MKLKKHIYLHVNPEENNVHKNQESDYIYEDQATYALNIRNTLLRYVNAAEINIHSISASNAGEVTKN